MNDTTLAVQILSQFEVKQMSTSAIVAFRNTLIIFGTIELAVAIGLVFASFLPIIIAVIGCVIWIGNYFILMLGICGAIYFGVPILMALVIGATCALFVLTLKNVEAERKRSEDF